MAGDFHPEGTTLKFHEHGGERRGHTRYPLHLRILVAVGHAILQGRTEDVSAGGACLRLDDLLPEGLPVAVRFLTPYLKQFGHFDVNAKVQYAAMTSGDPPCRIGVKFVGADAEVLHRLSVLLNTQV